jgi:heme exporter protein C
VGFRGCAPGKMAYWHWQRATATHAALMHRFANPARFLKIARPLTGWLFWPGLALLVAGAFCGLFVTPADYLQGQTVRILYIHVPAAWLGMGGWTGIAVAALMQLVWRHPLAAVAGRAIALPGALFTAICLATGSIWGRPTWGTWWEWDGRMTSMLLLLFLYLGYIALGNASARQAQQGGVSNVTAIFGLVGAINIPIINRSVVWWNSLHQGPSITLRGSSIEAALLWPLGLTLAGFTLWFGAIVLMRMRAILAQNKVEARLQRLARG